MWTGQRDGRGRPAKFKNDGLNFNAGLGRGHALAGDGINRTPEKKCLDSPHATASPSTPRGERQRPSAVAGGQGAGSSAR